MSERNVSKLEKEVILELCLHITEYEKTGDPKNLHKVHDLVQQIPGSVLEAWLPTAE